MADHKSVHGLLNAKTKTLVHFFFNSFIIQRKSTMPTPGKASSCKRRASKSKAMH